MGPSETVAQATCGRMLCPLTPSSFSDAYKVGRLVGRLGFRLVLPALPPLDSTFSWLDDWGLTKTQHGQLSRSSVLMYAVNSLWTSAGDLNVFAFRYTASFGFPIYLTHLDEAVIVASAQR